MTFVIEPSPATVGPGTVVVTLREGQGNPVEGAQLAVEGNMSHAGMVPAPGKALGGAGGVYRAAIEWTMAGDWFADVKLTLPDGTVVARRFPFSVGR